MFSNNYYKKKHKIKKFFFKNKLVIVLFIGLITFPLIIASVYAIPIKQILPINIDELLSFYGTALGIFSSFLTFNYERNKKKKERISELKPKLLIDVKLIDTHSNQFEINIKKLNENHLTHLYLYDYFFGTALKQNHQLSITFNQLKKAKEIDINICDNNILDSDGYPKYIQISCSDIDSNCWSLIFDKIESGENCYYYLTDCQID